ncbi:unnamed protein product [Kuraishia capsulata CBS 1993]|uniref:BRCT domain-containing protein n=1 Tax=Kuraishia capsulata CBS 1993 TaxID=1382522 RepID=W6MJU4_9ASCO|nr:uncharacterized protein KUCA_T00002783001 [Kuraishia capsulata CBS 1993]CDK26809.1 unnamed protein product [Kuraishia capsulata CBS 1993]
MSLPSSSDKSNDRMVLPSLTADTQIIASELPDSLNDTPIGSEESEPIHIQNIHDDTLQVRRRERYVHANHENTHNVTINSPNITGTPFVRQVQTPNSNLAIKINNGQESQTPLFAKIKNPFEDTPTSEIPTKKSILEFGIANEDTPSVSAESRSKRALETFKRLGENDGDIDMELELEDGIMLGANGGDDTFNQMNSNKGDITTATIDEGDYDDEVNRALRNVDISTNEPIMIDNSEATIIHDRQPDDHKFSSGLHLQYENSQVSNDGIQVPASIEKVARSRSQGVSQSSIVSSDGDSDNEPNQETPLPKRRSQTIFSLSVEHDKFQAFSTPISKNRSINLSKHFTQELSELEENDEARESGKVGTISTSAETQVIHGQVSQMLSLSNDKGGLVQKPLDKESNPSLDTGDKQVWNSSGEVVRDNLAEVDTTILYDKYIWARIERHKVPAKISQLFPNDTVDVLYGEDSVARIKKSQILAPMEIHIGDQVRIKDEAGYFKVTGLRCKRPDMSEEIVRSIRGFDTVYLVGKTRPEEFSRDLSSIYCTRFPNRSIFKKFNDEEAFEKFIQGLKFETDATEITPSGIFQGYCFCFTRSGVDNEEDFKRRTQFILDSGGVILENGFTELLEPSSDLSFTRHVSLKSFRLPLTLSNKPCRTEKYLQALALGWPLLSEKFIDDCISNKENAKSWFRYLLAAGESQWHQSTMSLNIFEFYEKYRLGMSLWDQVNNNSNILAHYQVLIINKSINVKRETLLFILTALGVKTIHFVASYQNALKKAKDFEMDGSITAVYSEDAIEEVVKQLSSKGAKNTRNTVKSSQKSQGIKKFFPSATPAKRRITPATDLKGLNIRYINWEWIVQCVICSHSGEIPLI